MTLEGYPRFAAICVAIIRVEKVREKYWEAARYRSKYALSGKPGKQRRENEESQAERVLEEAEKALQNLCNPKIALQRQLPLDT